LYDFYHHHHHQDFELPIPSENAGAVPLSKDGINSAMTGAIDITSAGDKPDFKKQFASTLPSIKELAKREASDPTAKVGSSSISQLVVVEIVVVVVVVVVVSVMLQSA